MPKKDGKPKKKLSAWNLKIRSVAKSNPNMSFASIIQKAKKEYKPKK